MTNLEGPPLYIRTQSHSSMPSGSSVNNFMHSTCEDFKYNSVNDVMAILNEGDFMCVVDIASPYRAVPIFPSHSDFQGLRLNFDDGRGDVLLRENQLYFGLKCAPFIFSLLSDLAVDMVKFRGVDRIVNYLDDFLLIEDSWDKCVLSH